jgi:hypothetical protein
MKTNERGLKVNPYAHSSDIKMDEVIKLVGFPWYLGWSSIQRKNKIFI